jgi:sugar fermentation stimulation protein A
MGIIKLYADWEEAYFVERDNRFVMTLQKDKELMKVYVANPGRMEEFLIPGHPFFISRVESGKYQYRVVSTKYQESYVLLDTIKINYLTEQLLKNRLIPELDSYSASLKREVNVSSSRFDFLLRDSQNKKALLEVKSCSLCHNGIAMFPDAPTKRGKRHLDDLNNLVRQGYECFTLYFITHRQARTFVPNGHTDLDYCQTFNRSKNIQFLAYRVPMNDPISFNLSNREQIKRIPIDSQWATTIGSDVGSYLLIFSNPRSISLQVGSLGQKRFKKGYYVYCGSALKGIQQRLSHHLKIKKNPHWHIDYITPKPMTLMKTYRIRRPDPIEEPLAEALVTISDDYIQGFGSSDSKAISHLAYFKKPPHRCRSFIDILLNFQTQAIS